MIKYIILFVLMFSLSFIGYSQEQPKQTIDIQKLPPLRDNSRDMVSLRKGNVQGMQMVKQQRKLQNSQRLQMHKKSARMQQQKTKMNKNKSVQMRRMRQQKAMQRRNH